MAIMLVRLADSYDVLRNHGGVAVTIRNRQIVPEFQTAGQISLIIESFMEKQFYWKCSILWCSWTSPYVSGNPGLRRETKRKGKQQSTPGRPLEDICSSKASYPRIWTIFFDRITSSYMMSAVKRTGPITCFRNCEKFL